MGVGSERRGGRRGEDERKKITCVCVGVMVSVFLCVACVGSSKKMRIPIQNWVGARERLGVRF